MIQKILSIVNKYSLNITENELNDEEAANYVEDPLKLPKKVVAYMV